MCGRVLDESIIGRARAAGKLTIDCHDIRAFTEDKHRRVDDSPYGGGMGMVMQPGPIYNCFRYLCRLRGVRPHVIYLSPKGQVFTQRRAGELANMNNLLLLCGHYEGVDQRILDEIAVSYTHLEDICSPYPIDEKFAAFGFATINIDAHDYGQIAAAFAQARQTKGKPTAVIAKSTKGKGVSFMEGQASWHGTAPNEEQYRQAMGELQKLLEAYEGGR